MSAVLPLELFAESVTTSAALRAPTAVGVKVIVAEKEAPVDANVGLKVPLPVPTVVEQVVPPTVANSVDTIPPSRLLKARVGGVVQLPALSVAVTVAAVAAVPTGEAPKDTLFRIVLATPVCPRELRYPTVYKLPTLSTAKPWPP